MAFFLKILNLQGYYSGFIFFKIFITIIHKEVDNIIGNFSIIGIQNIFFNKYGSKDQIDKMIELEPEINKRKIMEKINEK